MIEQSIDNTSSNDNSIDTEQVNYENGDKLHQNIVTDEMLPYVIQLSKQIRELDKKNIRIVELISSIKKDIRIALSTPNHIGQFDYN